MSLIIPCGLAVRTTWDADRYADFIIGHSTINEATEARLKAEFPPLFSEPTLLVQPGIITDIFGKILVWYLPAILHPRRQVWSIVQNLYFYHSEPPRQIFSGAFANCVGFCGSTRLPQAGGTAQNIL